MEAFALITLAAPIMLIAVLACLAIVVTGIRQADRTSLRSPAASRLGSITRRIVGGLHDTAREDEDR